MSRGRLIFAAALLLGTVLVLNSLLAGAEPEKIDDAEITMAVDGALMLDEMVSAHLLDVETRDGVVTLSGTVDNILARERAAKVAQTIRGVRSVINHIGVACIVKPDDSLREDISAALAEDPSTRPYDIAVRVDDGEVTLDGVVDSWDGKQIVAGVAKGVAGVREITNNIGIDYVITRPDDEIRDEVLRRLELDPYVYEGLIDVEVFAGEVTLEGTVGSAAERVQAAKDAWVTGVTGVESDGLEIRWWASDSLRRESRVIFVTDEEVKHAVEDALRFDTRTSEYDFDVNVQEHRVRLSGVTDNLIAKSAAGETAMNTTGVADVENLIKVRPEAGFEIEDLTGNVKRALARDPLLERYNLTPIVRNQKVYLYGTVDTFCDRQRAVDVASRVWGVAAVKDNLKVNAAVDLKDDDRIKEDIESQLFWSVFVSGGNIEVSVEDGVATLTGSVYSWQELKAAIENAFDGGAVAVKSNLAILDLPAYTHRYYRPGYMRPIP
jgi:osmotically-inducible protein OsmY